MISELLILVVLLTLSACFSAAETALFSVDNIRIQTLAQKKNAGALIVKQLRDNPKRLLGTVLLCNNAVNLAASSLVTVMTIRAFGQLWIGVATGVLTLAIVMFGEFLPKTLAANNSEAAALFFARPTLLLTRICSPIVYLLEKPLEMAFGQKFQLKETRIGVSEEEIKTMAHIGAKAGTLEKGERELIERVFLFNDITAEDVMTPREDVKFLDSEMAIRDAVPMISKEKFSRYPVLGKDENDVIGIVHIRDIFEKIAENPESALKDVHIHDLASEAMYVPETKLIDDLFREFQKSHTHMALVINEYGSLVGVVTTDDLLEELVGEIGDETDVEDDIMKRIDKHTAMAHGDEELRDVNEFMNVKLPGRANKTISRLVLERLGKIPEVGDVAELNDNVTAIVEAVEKRRIKRVKLIKKPNDSY